MSMGLDHYIDFFVTLWGNQGDWLIFRKAISPENCVRVCGSQPEACEDALKMAQYHVATGQDSQCTLANMNVRLGKRCGGLPDRRRDFLRRRMNELAWGERCMREAVSVVGNALCLRTLD